MKKLLTILVLIMLIISFFQITSMYALYREELESEYNTLLGVWAIKVNGSDISSGGQQNLTFEITDEDLKYVASQYIQENKIAPNGKASFDIEIDPTNTDVSIIYQINLESIDIPNAQMKLLSVDNYFKKDGQANVTNTEVNQNGNLYTGVIPMEKIRLGYKNHLTLNFQWVNEEINNIPDSSLGNPENATNQNITWTTSNEGVAKIVNGVITAVSAGTADITVTTVDGSYTETCTVTVTEDVVSENIPAISTTLNKKQVTLKRGQTQQLLAAVFPDDVTNRNITFTSNNEDVATVTNGVITAVSAGTATITVKTNDGNYTDTCTVTVTEEQVDDILQVTGIDLDKTAVTLKVGETEPLVPYIWSRNQRLSIPLQINLKQYTGEGVGNGAE